MKNDCRDEKHKSQNWRRTCLDLLTSIKSAKMKKFTTILTERPIFYPQGPPFADQASSVPFEIVHKAGQCQQPGRVPRLVASCLSVLCARQSQSTCYTPGIYIINSTMGWGETSEGVHLAANIELFVHVRRTHANVRAVTRRHDFFNKIVLLPKQEENAGLAYFMSIYEYFMNVVWKKTYLGCIGAEHQSKDKNCASFKTLFTACC